MKIYFEKLAKKQKHMRYISIMNASKAYDRNVHGDGIGGPKNKSMMNSKKSKK